MIKNDSVKAPSHNLAITIFRNTGFILLGNTVLKGLHFLFTISIVRELGDNRFGQYSIVIAFVSLFQIFAELGMSQYAMREIARDRAKTQLLFWNLIFTRFFLGLIAIGMITLAGIGFGYSAELVLGIFIFTCSFLLAAFQAPLQMVLTANERFDYPAAMNIIGQTTFVVVGAAFLFSGLGYVWLIVASLISLIPQIVLGGWAVRRHGLVTFPIVVAPASWVPMVRSGLPFAMISLSLTVIFSMDTIILSKFASEREVGWYNVAYHLVFSVMFLFSSFKEAMVPSLVKTYKDDPARVEVWFSRMIKAILAFSLPIAVGGTIIAERLITFLYTDTYLPAVASLQIIIWDVPFLMFAGYCGNITTVVYEEKAAARIYLVGAVSNLLMNLVVIPRFGYIGASITTVITDLICAALFYYLLRRKVRLANQSTTILKVLLAAALMGIIIYLVGKVHLILTIILGASIYGVLLFLLRLPDEVERKILRQWLPATIKSIFLIR